MENVEELIQWEYIEDVEYLTNAKEDSCINKVSYLGIIIMMIVFISLFCLSFSPRVNKSQISDFDLAQSQVKKVFELKGVVYENELDRLALMRSCKKGVPSYVTLKNNSLYFFKHPDGQKIKIECIRNTNDFTVNIIELNVSNK